MTSIGIVLNRTFIPLSPPDSIEFDSGSSSGCSTPTSSKDRLPHFKTQQTRCEEVFFESVTESLNQDNNESENIIDSYHKTLKDLKNPSNISFETRVKDLKTFQKNLETFLSKTASKFETIVKAKLSVDALVDSVSFSYSSDNNPYTLANIKPSPSSLKSTINTLQDNLTTLQCIQRSSKSLSETLSLAHTVYPKETTLNQEMVKFFQLLATHKPRKIEALGDGNFGKVDLVKIGCQKYAVKAFKKAGKRSISERKLAQENIQSELKQTFLFSLNPHPAVTHCVGVFSETESDDFYEKHIVLPLYDGGEYFSKLRDENLSYEENLQYLIDIADGLAFMHEKGYKHCDLKPENCMLTKDNHAVIIDLGNVVESSYISQSGTWPYMPPEASNFSSTSNKYDVWMFGALLYRALTGEYITHNDDTTYSNLNEAAHLETIRTDYIHLVEMSKKNSGYLSMVLSKAKDNHKEILKKRDPKGVLMKIIEDCLQVKDSKRPDMKTIHNNLKKELQSPKSETV